jgi:hypothetical protein
VLFIAIWVEHGPFYALGGVLGGLGLAVIIELRTKRRAGERQ